MKNILVTAIGSFSADIVIKKLKEYGYRVIGCDIYEKEWIVDAYNVQKFYKVPYAINKEEYLQSIYEICMKNNIEYIVPLTDVEIDILNDKRNIFEEIDVTICIPPKTTVDICRDKKKITDILYRKKICKTIKTELISQIEINQILFPVVCKPRNGRSSQGVAYIKNIDSLRNYIKEISQSNYILQPYIDGNIITVDIIYQPETNYSMVTSRRELLRTQNGAGTAVYVFESKEIEEISISIAKELNIIGCVNFEFIETENGELYFMECNPRFSGGIEFSCIAGYDYILNHIKCFEYKTIDRKININNQYISRKYEEYITKIEG